MLPTSAILIALLCVFWHSLNSRIEQNFAIGIVVFVLAKGFFSEWRGVDVELRVTNLDLTSSGRSPSDYQPVTVPRADVYELQYRAVGGSEGQEIPEGLYAQYKDGSPWEVSACLLPHIGSEQTEEVIKEILDRFPDTCTLASRASEASPLISLNLSAPADQTHGKPGFR
jgi:hypothetical protein